MDTHPGLTLPLAVVPPEPAQRGMADRDITHGPTDAPDTAELETVNRVRQLFTEARAKRRPLVEKWKKSYRVLQNNGADLSSSYMPNPAIPEIFPIIASMVGWATDQRVKEQVSPATPQYSPYNDMMYQMALDLETVMESTFHVNLEEREVEIMLWDAFTYGTGVVKTVWDQTLQRGQGDATIRRIDPFTYYPDPEAKNMEECDYHIEAKRMSIQQLDRRFPGWGEYFNGGGYYEDSDQSPDQLDSRGRFPRANPGAVNGGSSSHGMPGANNLNVVQTPGVTVLECWMRDHEYYESTRQDLEGDKYTDQRVYDCWRVVVVAGNRVLMDERADELWEHGQHPYDRYVPHDMGEFWGLSLVDLLSSAQNSLNRVLSAMQQQVELTGNPVLVEDSRSQISRTQITNKPGVRLRKTTGSEVDWLKPPPFHPGMPQLLTYYLQRMEAVSGLSAVTKGGSTPGRNAQGVVDSMQEAAFVRVRMVLRNLEWTLRGAFTKKASLISEFYTSARMVPIVGASGQRTSIALSARHFYTPPELGGTPMQFQLLINAGSNNHTSRKVREDQAVLLYTLGAFDEPALLEALEVPNRVEISRRVQAAKAAGLMQPPGARAKAQRTS